MTPNNSTQITIDGTSLDNFSHLSLVQRMYEHHSFQIVIGHEVMESLGGHTLDKSKSWVGKLAIITLGENTFSGIVTNVDMVHRHGLFGDLVISGYSQSILLESMPHFYSWTDKSLRDVVQDVIGRSGILSEVSPEFSGQIPYVAQHRESHYAFLKRLAKQFNEWMFYDGDKLLFGKPGNMPSVEIAHGTDMDDVHVSVQMRPIQFGGFAYNSLRDEFISGNSPNAVAGLGELGDHGLNSSKEHFGHVPTLNVLQRVEDKSGIDNALKRMQAASAASMSRLNGKSSNQSLRPGVIANVTANVFDEGAWSSKPYENYLITAVHHEATGDHVYSNYFEAIPSGATVLPNPDVTEPMAHPQLATVLSNEDPEQKGRIQVQFQWQMAEGLNTNWVRVMTPDGGVSDNVGTNRGYVFIPEVGDQVMVGFSYGDPSRPFVMGSMFHGKSGAGGDQNNKIKSITTRSGSTITFDDDEGDGNITISDPSGNTVVLNGDGTMSITAPEELNITSTKINISASDSIVISGEKKIDVLSKDIVQNGESSISLESKTKIEEKAPSISIEGMKSVEVKAAQVDVQGQAMTNIKGGMLNLN